MRFLEFAYTGGHTAPLPDISQPSTDEDMIAKAFARIAITRASSKPEPQADSGQYDTGVFGGTYSKSERKKSNTWCEATVEAPRFTASSTPSHELSYFKRSVPASPVESSSFETDSAQKPSRRALWEAFCSQACTTERQPWQSPRNNVPREGYAEVIMCHARLCVFSDRYQCSDLMTLSLQKLRLTVEIQIPPRKGRGSRGFASIYLQAYHGLQGGQRQA